MMNVHARLNQIALLQLCFFTSVLGVQHSTAQGQVLISKNADFSSQDVRFERTDILYLKINTPQVDYSDLDRNAFRLKPQNNSATFESTLENHLDGSYSIAVDLGLLDPTEDDWKVHVRLKDENGLEFRAAIEIDIGEDLDDDVDREMDQLSVTGTIDEKTDSTIKVAGLLFIVDPNIGVQDDKNEDITYTSLRVGHRIVIEGISFLDDNFATNIQLEELREDEIIISGTVEILTTNTVTVAGFTFDVSTNTQVNDINNSLIQFPDLTIGLTLEINANIIGNDQLIATHIKVENYFDDEVKLRGSAEQITESAMTVLGQQLTITENTQLLDENNTPTNIATFSEGTIAVADADLQPDGKLIALQIKQETEDISQIVVRGMVDSVATDMLVVAGVNLLLNNNSVYLDTNGNPVLQSTLGTGQSVEVTAELLSGNMPVVKETRIKRVTSIVGIISNLNVNSFAIGPFNFGWDENSIFLNQNNQPISAGNVSIGQISKMRTVIQADTLTTSRFKLLNKPPNIFISAEQEDLPKDFELFANYPNPFNPTTTLSFNITQNGSTPVSLVIYNTLGRKVKTLTNEAMNTGQYSFEWNASDEAGRPVASGIYLYRLQVGDLQVSRSMTLIK